MSLIPSCPEVHENLTEYLEGSLPFHKRIGIRLHLVMCKACNALRNVLVSLPIISKRALAAPADPVQEAKDALSLVMSQIKAPKNPGS